MVLVMCEICDELHELESWNEGNCFICVICAKILENIKQIEIKKQIILNDSFKLAILDSFKEEYNKTGKIPILK